MKYNIEIKLNEHYFCFFSAFTPFWHMTTTTILPPTSMGFLNNQVHFLVNKCSEKLVTFDALLFQNYVKYLKNALYTCM